jgi:cytochrome c oxidase assembly protein subunit 11
MSRDAANRVLLRKLAFVAVAMFGFGFALVPFYKQICEVTGINNLIKPDTGPVNTQVDTSRTVTIELDANTQGLPWRFAPVERTVRVHPGELVQVTYEIVNDSSRPVAGQAIPSYGPKIAAEHFRKLECFCFKQQLFQPGETRQMPVVFVIDPKLPADVNTITLSYTFFEVQGVAEQPRKPDAS